MLDQHQYFERALWPHLRGAYNLARWLLGNEHDAEDVVQESFTKALGAVERFQGSDARPWLFAIVRNTAMNYIQRQRPKAEVEWSDNLAESRDNKPGPETRMLQEERRRWVRAAIARLPREFREALVLREIEGLAYKEIAWILKIPIGTVMSRLSRARGLLLQELVPVRKTV